MRRCSSPDIFQCRYRVMTSKNGADYVNFVMPAIAPASQNGQSRATVAFHRNAQLRSPGLFTTTCLRSTSWSGYMISSFLLVQAGAAFILTLLFICLQRRYLRGLILTKGR